MSVDNSRIAKNTVYLYIRMIFVLGANFFAVRAVDITKDADSERTPRGETAPLQNLTSFLTDRIITLAMSTGLDRSLSGSLMCLQFRAAVTRLLAMLDDGRQDAQKLCSTVVGAGEGHAPQPLPLPVQGRGVQPL